MRRKQVTAILLSAILSVSACLPVSSIPAFAAENGSTQEAAAMEQEDVSTQQESQQSVETSGDNDNGSSDTTVPGAMETENEENDKGSTNTTAPGAMETAKEENDNGGTDTTAPEAMETEDEENSADTGDTTSSVMEEETGTEERQDDPEDAESDRIPADAGSESLSGDAAEKSEYEESSEEADLSADESDQTDVQKEVPETVEAPAETESVQTDAENDLAEDNNLMLYCDGPDHSVYSTKYVTPGEEVELKVTATAVDTSQLNYSWNCIMGSSRDFEGRNLTTIKTDPIYRQTYYSCTVWDQYGNTRSVTFVIYGKNNLKACVEGSSTGEGALYVSPGASVELKVNATADDTSQLKYQWYEYKGKYSENSIDGATSSVYRINSISYPSRYRHQYRCYVSDQYGNSTQVRFSIYVEGFEAYADDAHNDRRNIYVSPGEAAELKVNITAPENCQLNYTWYEGDVDEGNSNIIEGADSAVYRIDSVQQSRRYSCTVKDQYENSGKTVTFYVYVDNQLEAYADGTKDDWVDIYTSAEGGATLKVAATATDPSQLKYTWYEGSVYGGDIIAGADSATYSTGSVPASSYTCVVSDQFGNKKEVYFEVYRFSAYADEEGNRSTNLYVTYGETAELKVIARAADISQLTYSWYLTDQWGDERVEIDGAEAAVYKIDAVSKSQNYCCKVYSPSTGESHWVYFYVLIDNQLKAYAAGTKKTEVDLYVPYGQTADLKVSATAIDSSKLVYAWHLINDATVTVGDDPSIAKTGSILRSESYACDVTDQYGNSQTVYFDVYVDNKLEAYVDGTKETHAYMTVSPGDTVDLKVEAAALNADNLTYEWRSLDYNDFEESGDEYLYRHIFGSDTPVLKNVAVRNIRRDLYCTVSDSYRNEVKVYFHINSLKNTEPVEVFCGNVVPVSPRSYPLSDCVYKFTPQETTEYVFYYSGGSIRNSLELLDEQMHFIGKYPESDRDSHLRARLEEGKTYYLIVYNEDAGTEDLNLHIELFTGESRDVQTISAQDLFVGYSESKKINVAGAQGTLSFSSSNNAVASVDNDGVVTGKAPGTALITISAEETEDYLAADPIQIKVTVSALSISAQKVSVSASGLVYDGKAKTPAVSVSRNGTKLKAGTDYTVSYKNNTNAGTASVTITGKGNYTGTKTATFTISKAAQSITAKTSASYIAAGKTATVSITGAKGTKSYKSSDTSVATVNASTGVVTGKKAGTVTITATSDATSNYNAASKTVRITILKVLKKPGNCNFVKWNNTKYSSCQVAWNKTDGAQGYETVLSWTDGSHSTKKTVKSNVLSQTCTVTVNHVSQFQVRAYYDSPIGRQYSPWSNLVFITPSPTTLTKKNVSPSGSDLRMQIGWNIIYGCNGYNVFLTTNPNGTWYWNQSTSELATETKATVVKYRGSKLKKNQNYYVRIVTRRKRNGVFCTVPMPANNTNIGSFVIK